MPKYTCPSTTNCLVSAATYLNRHLDSHQNGSCFNYDEDQEPLLREAGSTTIGDEPYRAEVRVLILERSWEDYFHRPNPLVKKSENISQNAVKAAEKFQDVDESLVVVTADRVPMLFVLRDGMFAGQSPMEQERTVERSQTALEQLATNYNPPKKDNNVRDSGLKIGTEGQLGRVVDKGVYHFCYWKETGHGNDPIKLSKEALGKSASQKAAVSEYMRQSAWEHVTISRWLKTLDPLCWIGLNGCYQKNRANLEYLDQGAEGVQSCFVINFNHAVNPHKDKDDAKEGWVATNPWGKFTGGQLVLPELRLKITQPEGTLVLCRATVLEHWITPIDGERSSHTRFTRENVLNPVDPKDKTPCPFPNCESRQKYVGTFLSHFRHNHKAGTLTDSEVHEIEQRIESSGSLSTATKKSLRKNLQTSRGPSKTRAVKATKASAKDEEVNDEVERPVAKGTTPADPIDLTSDAAEEGEAESNKRKLTEVAPTPAKRQRTS